jgi:hypothetical protein
MKRYSVTTTWNLRELCIKNDWFTSGTIRQYDKLFYANENGCPIEEIATIIWICSSDECRRADVLDVLYEANREHVLNVIEQNGDREKLLTMSVEDLYNSYFD